MKRPMLLCGLGAIFVSATCYSFPSEAGTKIIVALFTAVLLFAVLGGIKRTVYLLPLLAVIIAIGIGAIGQSKLLSQYKSLEGIKTVIGVVSSVAGYDGTVGYTVDAERIGNIKEYCKIRVIDIKGGQLSVGDKVSLGVRFDEDCLSDTQSISDGVYFTGYLEKVHSSHETFAPIYMLRMKISEILSKGLDSREAGVIVGIALGEKSAVANETAASFRGAGISHILVVSGMHISILAGGIYLALRYLKLSNLKTGIIGILFVTALMAVMGFTVSVVRAGLTFVIMFAGLLFSRRPDPLNSLFLAITIILLFDSFAFMSISLQLSGLATFGVLAVAPGMCGSRPPKESATPKKLWWCLKSAFAITLSATVMTLPFAIYHFGMFSTVTLLANIIINPLATAVLGLAALAAICFFIVPLSEILVMAAGFIAKIMLKLTDLLSSLPQAQIRFEDRMLATVIAAVVAVGIAIIFIKKYDRNIKLRNERAVQKWLQ